MHINKNDDDDDVEDGNDIHGSLKIIYVRTLIQKISCYFFFFLLV